MTNNFINEFLSNLVSGIPGHIFMLMTILWIVSIVIKNVSIVDLFWGFGFVITSLFYFLKTDGYEPRKIILMTTGSNLGTTVICLSCLAKHWQRRGFPLQGIPKKIWREKILVDQLFSNLPSSGSADVAYISSSSRSTVLCTK